MWTAAAVLDDLKYRNEMRKVTVSIDKNEVTMVSPYLGNYVMQIDINELDTLITTLNKYQYSAFHFTNPSELEKRKPFKKKEHTTLHNQLIIQDDFGLKPDTEFTAFGQLNLSYLDYIMSWLYKPTLLQFCRYYDNYSKADEHYIITQIKKMVAQGLIPLSGVYISNLDKLEKIDSKHFQLYFPNTVKEFCKEHNIIGG